MADEENFKIVLVGDVHNEIVELLQSKFNGLHNLGRKVQVLSPNKFILSDNIVLKAVLIGDKTSNSFKRLVQSQLDSLLKHIKDGYVTSFKSAKVMTLTEFLRTPDEGFSLAGDGFEDSEAFNYRFGKCK